jgi:hypothetical protein
MFVISFAVSARGSRCSVNDESNDEQTEMPNGFRIDSRSLLRRRELLLVSGRLAPLCSKDAKTGVAGIDSLEHRSRFRLDDWLAFGANSHRFDLMQRVPRRYQPRFRARATEISRFDYRDPKSRAARIGAHISTRIDISVGPRAR